MITKVAIEASSASSGGAIRFLSEICPALSEANSDILFYLLNRTDQHSRLPSLPTNFQWIQISDRTAWVPFRLAWLQIGLPRILTTIGADVLLSASDISTLRPPCPMVLMAHNINPFSKLREQIWSRKQLLRMAVHRGVIRAVARRANKVVFVSEWSRQEMSSALAIPLEKTSVVYHGVDGIFKSRPKQTALENRVRYILAVSEVLEHKNFERLIETFIRLCKSLDEEVHLLIAGRIGSESLRRSLEERLTRESMIDRVKFLGFVSGEELAALYRQAELLVFPSVEETFGFPLIEAMASGLPVVTSNRSAMPEICGDAAQYFDPLDIDDMTQTIERVLIDPSLRDSLTKRGLKRSEEFSWIKSANSLLSILNSAASVTEPIRCES